MSKSKLSLVLGLSIIFLVILGIIFWRNKTNRPLPAAQIVTDVSQTQNQNQALDDGWLEYENPKYHYRLRYDQTWHKQAEMEPPYPPPPEGMNFSKTLSQKTSPPSICALEILSSENPPAENKEMQSMLSEPGTKHRQYTTQTFYTANEFIKDNPTQQVMTTYFRSKNYEFRVTYNYIKNEITQPICPQTLNKMLDSLVLPSDE